MEKKTDTINKHLSYHSQEPSLVGVNILKQQLKTVDNKPGVYQMLNQTGDVLYVGKALNLRKRISNYTIIGRLPIRIQRMIAETRSLEIITTHTEAEALLLECNLIKKLRPRYNILLRDDKSFPYILITKHPTAPALTKHRGAKNIPGSYYGPFLSGQAVNSTLIDLQRAFLLRSCSDHVYANRSRPCLLYQIKRCAAPCVGKINTANYFSLVEQAQNFLTGKNVEIQNQLRMQMQQASEALNYEMAANYRDRLRALTHIQTQQHIFIDGLGDTDMLGFYQEGDQSCIQVFLYRNGANYGSKAYFPIHHHDVSAAEIVSAFISQFYSTQTPPPTILVSHPLPDREFLEKALSNKSNLKIKIISPKQGIKQKALEQAQENAKNSLLRRFADTASQKTLLHKLAEYFALPTVPNRIEVYDNSHLQGTNAFGAMIVAGPEGFMKNAYRKFAIRPDEITNTNDDYAMMRQVFRRRFKKDLPQSDNNFPDLILVDGGKGQLQAVCTVLNELDINQISLIAIAKGPERNSGQETFFTTDQQELKLPKNDPLLHFLQRLRDEAHRFVIGAHRQGRQKQMYSSPLDEITGIGPKRKKALLLHFGSAKEVARAGIDDLQRIPGINLDTAKRIYSHFHDQNN